MLYMRRADMRSTRRHVIRLLLAFVALHCLAPVASAVVLTSSWPIAGDSVPVTLTLTDLAGGNGVEITVAIPEGEGDLLGLFGNVTDETLVPQLDAAGTLVTQEQYAANEVWKVGGGNDMSPVLGWDWGLRFESANWQYVDIHTVTFQLTAPGLTVAHLAGAANQGWYFGVRIQHTQGAKTLARIGFPVTPPPPGDPPTISITAPADGAVLGSGSVTVSGPITGTPQLFVNVNGLSAPQTGGGTGYTRTLTLADGVHSILAKVGNSYGHSRDEISITVDTVAPVVAITAPANGATLTSQPIAVTGTATDAGGIAALRINDDPIAAASPFATTTALAEGSNTITVEATDSAGNTGSASVTVTYAPSAPLAVEIETPPDGSLSSASEIEVAGTVSDPSAAVRVNGVLAAVTGARWVAARVPLTEGANTLTAVATRSGQSASDSVAVAYNAPPRIVITSPSAGDLFRVGTTDVEGVVDDAAAFVDVNGVVASVGSGGHFLASAVSLGPGDNTLVARAIDALGARGTDSVAVVRDDEAAGRSKLVVFSNDARWTREGSTFASLGDWDADLDAANAAELPPRPFDVTRARMLPKPDAPVIYPNLQVMLFMEEPDSVEFAAFREGETEPFYVPPSAAAPVPIGDLLSYVNQSPEAVEETLALLDFPAQFLANEYSLLSPCLPEGCGAGAVTGGRFRLRGTSGGIQHELAVAADVAQPIFGDFSPSSGSVVAGNVVSFTGTVSDKGPLLDSVAYAVTDELGATLAEGFVPLEVEEIAGSPPEYRGRFAIPDLVLGDGLHFVALTAWDAIGKRTALSAGSEFTVDADAPAVTLADPPDGSAFTEAEVPVSLNFGAATTLISVNGVPDGRSFPAGIATNVLTLPLAFGPNVFQLEVQNVAGVFTLSFTLHRVAEAGVVRIAAPTPGALVNTPTLTVTGTVPLGTPAVVVNGVLGTIAPDRVSFSATIPVPSTGLELVAGEARRKPYAITAEALPFGGRTTIEITPDFSTPVLRTLLPADGAITFDPSAAFSGFVSEEATVTLTSATDAVRATTVRDRAREANEPFNLFAVRQFHRFELPALDLAEGANALTLRVRDRAGNELVQTIAITRGIAALALTSPAAGSSIGALSTDLVFSASAAVTIDGLIVAGRQIPAAAGQSVAAGSFTLTGVPLAPGTNDVRVVYHREGAAQEVLAFALTSTASSFATVTGHVTDERTGAPLAGALVNVTAGGVSFTIVTDAAGGYRADVAPGAVVVVTAAEGYASASLSGSASAGATLTADAALGSTGLPAVLNEVHILVPPPGTVTDFEQLTVVGTVLHPTSSVTVNGIAAQAVGNRFTAKHVPLAMGANTIAVEAAVLGLPDATASVAVERAAEPVLAVKIFSPPDGASVPGGGLVVRGFVSARDALVQVSGGGIAVPDDGVFGAMDVALPIDATQIEVAARTIDGTQSEFLASRVTVDRSGPALLLGARPPSGSAPFETELELTSTPPSISLTRIDFDLEGDGFVDVEASASATAAVTIPEPTLRVARAYATTPEGVELTAPVALHAHLPATSLREFAVGNPVDLAAAADGGLYVLDASAGRITHYDPDGTVVGHFGSSGGGPDQLANPQALALDAEGRFYVADTGNDRVQVFSAGGVFERSIGAGTLSGPAGIAVGGDLLVVSDTAADRLRIFRLDGAAIASVPIGNPRGLAAKAAGAVLVASPIEGLRSFADGTLTTIPAIESQPREQQAVAPIDVSEGSDSTLLVDASTGSVVQLWPSLQLRRVISDIPGVKAVLPSERREIESIYVADGRRVTELGLPVPSPLPTLSALRARLLALDIEGALEWISPERRAYFRDLYERSGSSLATEAAAMGTLEIDVLREGRAVALIHREDPGPTGPVDRQYPVYLVRSADGRWLVLDY